MVWSTWKHLISPGNLHLQAGCLFTPSLQKQLANEFDSHLYSLGIQEAFRLSGIHESTLVTPAVTYKGTKYQKSMVVIVVEWHGRHLWKNCTDIDKFIRCSFCHWKIPISALSWPCVHRRLDSGISYVCVSVEDLVDYYPLSLYKQFDVNLVPLHLSV